MMKPLIEIDGKRIEYTDFYPEDECICGIQYGHIVGADEWPSGDYIAFQPTKAVGVLNVYRHDEKGRWGVKAIYKNATWAAGEDDMPLFRVSERIV